MLYNIPTLKYFYLKINFIYDAIKTLTDSELNLLSKR